jgi:hypothetical protein
MVSMHSLLSRTTVVDVPNSDNDFGMFEIRRDNIRREHLLYIIVFKNDVARKILSKSTESYFIEPFAEIVIRNNVITILRNQNTYIHEYKTLDINEIEEYFCSIVRLNSKKTCDVVIRLDR